MTKGDGLIEGGADRLEEIAEAARRKGGLHAKLGGDLHEDAAFLRKLKPSLIAARARGRAPKNAEPGTPARPVAPNGPQLGPRTRRTGGPNPFLVAGGAFGLGALLAKIIDWRGHAHPRR